MTLLTPFPLEDGVRRTSIATSRVANTQTSVVYAQNAIPNPDTNPNAEPTIGHLWKSTDGGLHFSPAPENNTYSANLNQGWFANVIWADPNDANTVVSGGLDLVLSDDGATSWRRISDWPSGHSGEQSAHADHHVIMPQVGFGPVGSRKVYVGNDGGVDRADDLDSTTTLTGWTQLRETLGTTQVYGMDSSAGSLAFGTQDNGSLSRDNDDVTTGLGWTRSWEGDGGPCVISPNDPDVAFYSMQYGQVYRGVVGANQVDPNFPMTPESGQGKPVNFIAPYVRTAGATWKLLLGAGRLWRCSNPSAANPSWTSVKAASSTPNNHISAIGTHPTDGKFVWVGHNNGDIYRTKNIELGTPNWSKIDTGNLPNRWVSDIEVVDDTTAYVCFMGWEYGNLWKTTNSGRTWTNLHTNGTFPQAPVSTMAVIGSNLYVGTDLGLFHSEDGGTTWVVGNNGPNNVSVEHLVWDDVTNKGYLYAATYGRGVYRLPVLPNLDIVSAADHTRNAIGGYVNGITSESGDIALFTNPSGFFIRNRGNLRSLPIESSTVTITPAGDRLSFVTESPRRVVEQTVDGTTLATHELPAPPNGMYGEIYLGIDIVAGELYSVVENTTQKCLLRYRYRENAVTIVRTMPIIYEEYYRTMPFVSMAVSHNGRYIAFLDWDFFASYSRNGQWGDPSFSDEYLSSSAHHVFVYDRVTGEVQPWGYGTLEYRGTTNCHGWIIEWYESEVRTETSTHIAYVEQLNVTNDGVPISTQFNGSRNRRYERGPGTTFNSEGSISVARGLDRVEDVLPLYTPIPDNEPWPSATGLLTSDKSGSTAMMTNYLMTGPIELRAIDLRPGVPKRVSILPPPSYLYGAALLPSGSSYLFGTTDPLLRTDTNGELDAYVVPLVKSKGG